MKSDTCALPKIVSESRKVRKPLMEKKRRARINDSLETLKQMLLDSKASLREASEPKKGGQRSAKLEKADILEMTVRYIQSLRNKLNPKVTTSGDELIKASDSSTDLKVGVTLIQTKLPNGQIVFVMPKGQENRQFDNVWRPW